MTNSPIAALPEPSTMPYEEAKEELRSIVTQLEVGTVPLEQTLELWQRGEALATRCRTILDAASKKIEEASANPQSDTGEDPF